MLIPSGLLLVLESDNSTLSFAAILVLLARPFDPVNLGLMWCTSLTSVLLRLYMISYMSLLSMESATYAGLGELGPLAQTIEGR